MKRILKIYMERPEIVALAVLVVLIVSFTASSRGLFLSAANLRGILSLFPELAIVALGFGLLMTAGEFDLSIGSVFGLAPMVLCSLSHVGVPFWGAFALALLVCVAIGMINGVVSLSFGIPSFITTLGMLFMLRSLCVVLYSKGAAPSLPDDAPVWAFSAPIGFIRVSVLWLAVLGVFANVLLEKTNFGNWIRATGSSLEFGEIGWDPHHSGEDRLFRDLFAVRRLRRDHTGCAHRFAAAFPRRRNRVAGDRRRGDRRHRPFGRRRQRSRRDHRHGDHSHHRCRHDHE